MEDSYIHYEEAELFLINGHWSDTNNCYGQSPADVYGRTRKTIMADASYQYIMKPWEAFFDKNVLHKFQHIYLPEEKGLKEGAIKRYIANFITQTRNLNIQRNTVEMKDANGLAAFEAGMQAYFDILAQTRNRGESIKEMLTTYVTFLHKLEDLKCIKFDVPSLSSKEYPIEDRLRYSQDIAPTRAKAVMYRLTYPDGSTFEGKPIDTLRKAVSMFAPEVLRRKEIMATETLPLVTDRPADAKHYEQIPDSSFYFYLAAGDKKIWPLIGQVLRNLPADQRPKIERV